jgi:hypothetical protein
MAMVLRDFILFSIFTRIDTAVSSSCTGDYLRFVKFFGPNAREISEADVVAIFGE